MTFHEKVRYLLVSLVALLLMIAAVYMTEDSKEIAGRVIAVILFVPILVEFFRIARRFVEWCLEVLKII